MTVPPFSFVIPTRNRRQLLSETLDSIRAQTVGDFELVVSNNNSEDDTAEYLASLEKSDRRVRVCSLDATVPVYENWNNGLRAALGKYVCLLHDDDLVEPTYIETAGTYLRGRDNIRLVIPSFDYFVIDDGGRHTVGTQVLKNQEVDGVDFLEDCLSDRLPMIHSGVLYHRETIARRGFCPSRAAETICADDVMLFTAGLGGVVLKIPEVLVHIRLHEARLTFNIQDQDLNDRIAADVRSVELFLDLMREVIAKETPEGRRNRLYRALEQRPARIIYTQIRSKTLDQGIPLSSIFAAFAMLQREIPSVNGIQTLLPVVKCVFAHVFRRPLLVLRDRFRPGSSLSSPQ